MEGQKAATLQQTTANFRQ